jgi:hypothetical protein
VKPDEAPLLPSLNDAADPALRAAIADLRGNQPDIAQLASLASRLALQGVAVTAPAAGAGAAAGKLWKKLALAGGGAASGVALWWLSSASPVEAPVPVPSRQASSTSAVATPARARSERSTAVGVRATPGDSRENTPEVEVAPGPTPASSPSTSPLVAEREPDLQPVAPIARGASEASARLQPQSEAAKTRAVAPTTPSDPAGSLTGVAAGPTEIELLRDARLALRQSPSRALELTEAHARAFPRGKLTQERELIAISSLVALGRRTAALSRASRFNDAFPQSPYRSQIVELLH